MVRLIESLGKPKWLLSKKTKRHNEMVCQKIDKITSAVSFIPSIQQKYF